MRFISYFHKTNIWVSPRMFVAVAICPSYPCQHVVISDNEGDEGGGGGSQLGWERTTKRRGNPYTFRIISEHEWKRNNDTQREKETKEKLVV